jgi:ribonuclease VapC
MALLPGSVIGAVNLAEVFFVLTRNGFTETQALEMFNELNVAVEAFSPAEGADAGLGIRPELVRLYNLSLGDRCCLATARRLKLPVLTTDKVWKNPGLGVEVQLVR